MHASYPAIKYFITKTIHKEVPYSTYAPSEAQTHSEYTCCQIYVQLRYLVCCLKSIEMGRGGVGYMLLSGRVCERMSRTNVQNEFQDNK